MGIIVILINLLAILILVRVKVNRVIVLWFVLVGLDRRFQKVMHVGIRVTTPVLHSELNSLLQACCYCSWFLWCPHTNSLVNMYVGILPVCVLIARSDEKEKREEIKVEIQTPGMGPVHMQFLITQAATASAGFALLW